MMRRELPVRFWFEAVIAVVGLILLALTLITREWFELLTGLDPDGRSGTLETALVVALLVISAASTFAARRDYQRAAS
jgi:hypothetical protein